ncbi:putative GNAT family N-acyltransferase [Dysgonomonas sp. PH5-45]|uniref:GNAT family N-acetyltransferase n=1 Tax=unclassified Dysgonomonas TaxID=2630389 RepID=UPI002474F1DB|nr:MULTISPECIES: GNAT family N-acetyltransferase [unclassified Dysgonomonas]MDH6355637.1 putative GNAT family N-acyltransferase [Dysgonomonas sp. PH5-45]MDH6388534.1 putative GNAT family N-acyltransferase [Dysgonomonas sp. PH5-37]
MVLKTIEYNSPEYKQMVSLRQKILRTPLGLRFSEEDLMKDKGDILCACFDHAGTITGCCILTPINSETARLRQMAIDSNLQNAGVGSKLLAFAEDTASRKGFHTITLHARMTAVNFYRKNGYSAYGEVFTEVGISHIGMRKDIIQI